LDDRIRLKKLAARIDALVEKDEDAIRQAREISSKRRSGAMEVHRICATFVDAVNALATRAQVALDPTKYEPDAFREDSPNLIQINARGRIIQVEFHGTEAAISTEEFRVPYIMEGEVRCFNQELLDRQSVEEQLLFYCLEKHGPMWRYFDPRTYRSGAFDEAFLVAMMEQLV
jgi:hypothetical protein